MPDYKVSVIVPVYNSSKYLQPCIDSILAQSFTEFELICVDDGSTDDSLSILRSYEKQDARVRVLMQENKHAGVARNNGKAAARGEYLVFWDSDDFFHPDALSLLYGKAKEDDADVCICSARQYFEDLQKPMPSDGYITTRNVPEKLPFSAKMIPDRILNITTAHPWNKMFRSAYIKALGLDFQDTRNGNDIFFVINAIARAERITVVNKPLINYRINQSDSLFGSLTTSPLTPINNWIATRKSLIEHDAYPKKSFDNKILNTLVYYLHNINNYSAFKETFLFLKDHALAKLDLTAQEEGYYTSAANAECLRHLLNDSPEDFLVFFQNSTYRASCVKNGRVQELTRKVKTLRKKNQNTSDELAQHCAREKRLDERVERQSELLAKQKESARELRHQCAVQDKQIGKLNKDLERQAAELDRAKADLDAVRASASYRIGRTITAGPRSIKKLLKGNE